MRIVSIWFSSDADSVEPSIILPKILLGVVVDKAHHGLSLHLQFIFQIGIHISRTLEV